MPRVNPDILVWARESAGLSLEDAQNRLQVSSVERLAQIEQGDREPSRAQLVRMATVYRRPLLTFYLSERPRDTERGEDYRTLPERESTQAEALLSALVRDVQARQQLIRSALEEAREAESLAFVGSLRMEMGVAAVRVAIEETINFTREDYRRHRNVTEAFAALRQAVESQGVYVLLKGNLGSHHSNISATVFRGFTISDSIAPFIVLNENDARSAWAFTLLHELTHVFLGQTGISGYESDAAVERFCDNVAAAFLLEAGELEQIELGDTDVTIESISEFANARNLSRKMVAFNLWRQNLISIQSYRQICAVLDQQRVEARNNRGPGAPDYYVVRRHRVGAGLVSAVSRMLGVGTLSTTKASQVLGVRPTGVSRMVSLTGTRS